MEHFLKTIPGDSTFYPYMFGINLLVQASVHVPHELGAHLRHQRHRLAHLGGAENRPELTAHRAPLVAHTEERILGQQRIDRRL